MATSTLEPPTSTLSLRRGTLQLGANFLGSGTLPLNLVSNRDTFIATAFSVDAMPSSSLKNTSTMSFRSRPAALRSCWTWLMSSLDFPADKMASSWVQSMATTTSPSWLGVASHSSPSLEKESLDTTSVLVSMATPSTSNDPLSRAATASSCVRPVILALAAFMFFPSFFPRILKSGMRERVTQSCSFSLGMTWKSQALSSERMYVLSGPVIPSTTTCDGLRRTTATLLMGVLRLILRFSRALRPSSTTA
mmetsp:Transcript_9549/g.26757  ORF Transcript_9549/g.26757 Transcript_9549/m.26757 type:complete len:250 (-) Transcript_9549:2484-3233(-)